MCAIVGFIDKTENLQLLKTMLYLQTHRGPDDSGVYFDANSGVHLGHNRLAVQDLSNRAHQPFISDCGQYIIIFNGEVYNFCLIRQELVGLGYKFTSNSDTEVILYSYQQWGLDAIAKFIGMFVFAILDRNKNKLLLLRDRTGIKPLYYYHHGSQFMFSSELKSFKEHPHFYSEQNCEILPYYFQFGYIPAPYTIYKNCFKLEAGNYLQYNLDNSTFVVEKYWDIESCFLAPVWQKNERQIVNELEELLNDAISLRIISDVPVGVFLSGGFDSSLVTAILAKKHGMTIDTFTVGFNNVEYNEAKHAKAIAKYLGTRHNEFYAEEEDILNLVTDLPFYYDEPFGDSSALATMALAKFARKRVTVALSADGGDETFCGYSKYFALSKLQNIIKSDLKKSSLSMLFKVLSPNLIASLNATLPKRLRQTNIKDKYAKLQRVLQTCNVQDMFINASSYVSKDMVMELLRIKCNSKAFANWNSLPKMEFMNQMMALDYKLFLADDVLTKVDRATMCASLEAREPLLDYRLAEYMARVPVDLKYKNGQGKYILRQIAYKYLPAKLLNKPKSGFQVPLSLWLRGKLRFLVEDYLTNQVLDDKIFNIKAINKLKKDFFSGKEYGSAIWFILMYQMWREKWL